ncbi:MAG: DUF1080 domain-containing protein, partial [Xenococcaceae cyanobacterium MO_188.B19]|nr:DUF1080 domain-containing protein [Xenococcaceae cyanobacterium MO_188.B19]
DKQVRDAQSGSAFILVETLAGQPRGSALNTSDPNAPIEYFSGQDSNPDEDGIGTTYHECGTLWMGTDYEQSVTDTNGRFHHVYNAYCADQAIFTTAGSANPVPTGLALARKVARSLVERYQSAEIDDEDGFQSLYKGNFAADGWQYAGSLFDGQVPFFNVSGEQPILGAGLDNPGFDSVLGVLWYTPRTYSDFILKLEWKSFDLKANSGIFLRIPEPITLDNNFYDSSIEVQIDERGFRFDADNPANSFYGSPLHRTGAVYELFPTQQWAAKHISSRNSNERDFWNSYEIKLQGDRIEVKLNGKLVSQGTFSELLSFDAPSDGKKKRSEGFIGLQCHSEVVQFRNIQIQEL